ncbi:Choline transporter-like protein 3 [Varanus komodoensis]|nr:Choline transporter-like protein 3 [Varanus komodoensis]
MFVTGYVLMAGASERLIFGYDSYGNVCGRKNVPVAGAPFSGQDMSNKKFVFFLNSCGSAIKNLKISSAALCVSSCPQEQLNSIEDVQLFAENNGSCLCVYNLNATTCALSQRADHLCPTLPVPASVSFPLFNRCVPRNADCYSQFAPVLLDVVNEVDIFHRILGGLMARRDTVIGLCVLALAFSIIMMLAFRFFNLLVVRIVLTLLFFGLLFVLGVMWWLYYNYTNEPSIELEIEKENMKLLLGFSIVSTVITQLMSLTTPLHFRLLPGMIDTEVARPRGQYSTPGIASSELSLPEQTALGSFISAATSQCSLGKRGVTPSIIPAAKDRKYFGVPFEECKAILIFLILASRKRIHLSIQLLQAANKMMGNIPALFFQPLWTFIILILFWVYWVAVLLSLGTAGSAQVISGGQVEYKTRFGIRYMWWYHLVGLIWTSEFIVACQQMTIAAAVVTCFFNRNKSELPSHPVLSSISILFCYHLGTVVKGSLLITIVRVPRIILLSIYNILKTKENACARCMLKCCCSCFWCLERGLSHLNQVLLSAIVLCRGLIFCIENLKMKIEVPINKILACNGFWTMISRNAYTATVINGTNFCTSAEDAALILSKNSMNTMVVNCFGDFIIFLGKVFVVCFTVFGGLMAFNYHRELHVWVVPLLLVTFWAYLVAHCFLSVYQTILDVLFLCFAIDIETNDGSSEKPYFMDQELMDTVYESSKFTKEIKHRNKKALRKNEYDTELQPVVRNKSHTV